MKFICRMCKAEFSNPKDMSDHAFNEHIKAKIQDINDYRLKPFLDKEKQTINQLYEKSLENGGFSNG